MDKWLKRLWFLNGIVVLVAAILFIIQQVDSYFPRRYLTRGPIVGKKLKAAISDTLALQDISMRLPRPVGSTQYQFIEIAAKDLTTPRRIMESFEPRMAAVRIQTYTEQRNVLSSPHIINLIFMKEDATDAHLLLDKKALIVAADVPHEKDSLQHFILYRLVSRDTDDDGRLTSLDWSDLYISDVSGRNLRQITDEKVKVDQYTKLFHEGRILLQVRFRPSDPLVSKTDWTERVLVYDIDAKKLSPLTVEETLLEEAREILWSN